MKTDASGAPNSFAGGADDPETVYVVPSGNARVHHYTPDCYRLDDVTAEPVARPPTDDDVPDRVCGDCRVRRRVNRALDAELGRTGGDGR